MIVKAIMHRELRKEDHVEQYGACHIYLRYPFPPSVSARSLKVMFRPLEHHLMRELALRQTKAGFKIFGQVVLLLDGSNDGFVDFLLIR